MKVQLTAALVVAACILDGANANMQALKDKLAVAAMSIGSAGIYPLVKRYQLRHRCANVEKLAVQAAQNRQQCDPTSDDDECVATEIAVDMDELESMCVGTAGCRFNDGKCTSAGWWKGWRHYIDDLQAVCVRLDEHECLKESRRAVCQWSARKRQCSVNAFSALRNTGGAPAGVEEKPSFGPFGKDYYGDVVVDDDASAAETASVSDTEPADDTDGTAYITEEEQGDAEQGDAETDNGDDSTDDQEESSEDEENVASEHPVDVTSSLLAKLEPLQLQIFNMLGPLEKRIMLKNLQVNFPVGQHVLQALATISPADRLCRPQLQYYLTFLSHTCHSSTTAEDVALRGLSKVQLMKLRGYTKEQQKNAIAALLIDPCVVASSLQVAFRV